LKNAGVTFARMTKKVLGPQLQRNIIAYVDDIVVMSKNKKDHIADLKETFANLKAARLKLNLEKCISGVSKGKMLGYIISVEGIKEKLDKAKAIMTKVEHSTKKEVQRLTDKIVALSRFISKLAERSLPFFEALRGGDKVEWGSEQLKAFRKLKNYMATKLMVMVPDLEVPLLLYVAASDHTVSGVLAHKKEEGTKVVQRLVYFVSEALSGAKLTIQRLKK
jgi:hypothetical protein